MVILAEIGGQVNMGRNKPRIFIASSVEGIDAAYAIQELLEFSAECTVWDQDVFAPSSVTLLDLIKRAQDSDYGIFVFSFDDTIKIRDSEELTVRDNVVFELGLFIGIVGIANCFIVMPRANDDIHLPTDLTGITPLKYDSKRTDNNLKAALGPSANQIKKVIRSFTLPDKQVSQELSQQINAIGLNAFFSSRDDYNKYRASIPSIDRYIDTAKSSIELVSITLTTGMQIDDICSVIKNKINEQRDFNVTISLLNPFKDELYMTLEPVFGTDYSTLQNRTKDALERLSQLKKSFSADNQGRFSVKMHNTLPFGSAIILDGNLEGGKIQIETKPYKVGMRKSFAFEIINDGNTFYDTIKSSYYELIKDGDYYDDSME